jgi:sulfonate transport system permease protein
MDIKKIFLSLLLPISLIILWQFLYDIHILPSSQSSSPLKILKTINNLIFKGNLMHLIYTSISRLVFGVILGLIIGIIVGIFTATHELTRILLSPFLHFLSGIPVIVWIPFWIMVFGIGEIFKIGLVSISTFFLVFGAVFQSINSIDKRYIDLGRLYKKTRLSMIRKILIPYSLYSIYSATRLSLIIGWIVLFFVEYSISYEGNEGLGWFIANARSVGRIDEEFAGLITLGFFAFFIDGIINYYQNKSIKWKK